MNFLLGLPFFRVYVSFKEWLIVVFLELRFCRSSLSLLLLESTNLTICGNDFRTGPIPLVINRGLRWGNGITDGETQHPERQSMDPSL